MQSNYLTLINHNSNTDIVYIMYTNCYVTSILKISIKISKDLGMSKKA